MIGLGWNKNLEQNTSSHGMLYVLKRLADVKRCVAVPSEWALHKKVSRRTQQSICFNGYLAPVKANICTTTIYAQKIYLHNKIFPHNELSALMGIWRQKKKIFAKLIYLHIKKVC